MIKNNRIYNKPSDDILKFIEENINLINDEKYLDLLSVFWSSCYQRNYNLYEFDYIDLCDMVLEDTLNLDPKYIEKLRWEVFDDILINKIKFWKSKNETSILYLEDFIPQMYGRHGFTDEEIISHLDKYSESKFMGCYLANETYDGFEENLIYIIEN